MLLVSEDTIEQAPEVFPRVNIGNQGLGSLGNDDWERRTFHITASQRVAVKTPQSTILHVPSRGQRAGSGQEGVNFGSLNLPHV
jgi:hypothetical protein